MSAPKTIYINRHFKNNNYGYDASVSNFNTTDEYCLVDPNEQSKLELATKALKDILQRLDSSDHFYERCYDASCIVDKAINESEGS